MTYDFSAFGGASNVPALGLLEGAELCELARAASWRKEGAMLGDVKKRVFRYRKRAKLSSFVRDGGSIFPKCVFTKPANPVS
jgi:hypothetical protein